MIDALHTTTWLDPFGIGMNLVVPTFGNHQATSSSCRTGDKFCWQRFCAFN
jgi:hypothetical protein